MRLYGIYVPVFSRYVTVTTYMLMPAVCGPVFSPWLCGVTVHESSPLPAQAHVYNHRQ